MSKKLKFWVIIATSLITIGFIIFVGVMSMLKWDFNKLSFNKFVTNEYKLSDTFENISIKTVTADITLIPTDEQLSKVVCLEDKKSKHTVMVKDNTLMIDNVDTRKWYNHLGLHFKTPKITIFLPKGAYNALTINNTTGDIKIPADFTFINTNISVTTGDIFLESSVSDSIKCKSTTGDITLSGIRCGTLAASVTTGDVEMKDVIANGKITIHQCTGDVNFADCDANALFIKVTTGDVKGSLLSGKLFKAKTTTGKVEVPQSVSGGVCEVKATTGNIKIAIKK